MAEPRRTRGLQNPRREFEPTYIPAQDLNAGPPEPISKGTTLLTGGGSTLVGPLDPLSATHPPRLKIMVRLDLVTTHDIERLTRQFRGALKACLQQPGREQHSLRWLRTVKPAVFNRDLRRYDLHVHEHLTFRQIAYLEQVERRTGQPPMPAQLYGTTISIAPEKESSVRAAVVRIYESIHRVKYRARRQDPDGSNVPPYDCPEHPRRDCPVDCPVLRDWWDRLRPSLPKPNSGA